MRLPLADAATTGIIVAIVVVILLFFLSQAIKISDWVFASGQLGMDPKTGRLIEGGIKAETRQVCENLKAVLEAGGSSLARVAKVTIYMADLAELMAMNEVFREYFPKEPPARTTFQAAGLVTGARVEIEAIAFCLKASQIKRLG